MSSTKNPKWSRREFLKTTAVSVGGLTIFTALGGCVGAKYLRQGKQGPAVYSTPFNTNWRFGKFVKNAMESDFDDNHFELINLPHTVTPLSWRKWDPKSWEKEWIYRRRFTVDDHTKDKRVFLRIGAAMTETSLYLNGHSIGKHIGGYLPFEIEITRYLLPEENLLVAELNSRFDINVPPDKPGKDPTSVDFWQPGGIYRSAHLHIVPQTFIADVFAKPVNVLQADRKLDVECTLDAAPIPDGEVKIKVTLLDGKKKIMENTVPASIPKKGKTTILLSLENLKDIRLWDTDNPHLYDVAVTLFINNKPIHDYMVRTGFREARFTKKGFYLNGKRMQLFGVNRHQFYPFAGGAMPDRVQRKDAEILRHDLNCNMVRCSHYPQSEAFFDACDELGLLAWEEAAGWGSPLGNDEWKQRAVNAVEEMVRRDRNHPSIIVWGARLNETPDDVTLYSKTKELAYQSDGSRQTTGAMIGGLHNTKNFVQDVFSYNDYKKSKDENGQWQPELLPPRTDLPYLVSEAVGTLSGPYKYYRRTDAAIVQQGQAMAHARVHDIAHSNERYCGLLAWSGFDYPSGSGNQFEGVKYTGVIDLFREPKPGAAIYQAQVNPEKKPVIALAFYWHFGPRSLPFKNEEKAMICSNCERLELFIDGKHFTTLTPDKDNYPHLPYPPFFTSFIEIDGKTKPELRIDGYVNDKKMITQFFSSDTAGDQFLAKADDQTLKADGSDATRIVFRMTDQYGMQRPYAKGEVKFILEGPCVLIGDNPFAFADTGGVGAVWISTQPGRRGKISLQVQHELGSQHITIDAI